MIANATEPSFRRRQCAHLSKVLTFERPADSGDGGRPAAAAGARVMGDKWAVV